MSLSRNTKPYTMYKALNRKKTLLLLSQLCLLGETPGLFVWGFQLQAHIDSLGSQWLDGTDNSKDSVVGHFRKLLKIQLWSIVWEQVGKAVFPEETPGHSVSKRSFRAIFPSCPQSSIPWSSHDFCVFITVSEGKCGALQNPQKQAV